MVQFKDYYAILGVSKDATTRDIKSAYRKLARKYHPDVNQGDKSVEEKYKEINEAYTVLSDPEKREKYDKYGADWENISQGFGDNPFGGGGFDFFGGGGGSGFSNFFDLLFGGMGGQTQQGPFGGGNPFGNNPFGQGGGFGFNRGKGRDYEYKIDLPIETVYFGGDYVLSIDKKNVTVTIPKGIPDGYKMKLKGLGAPGQSEPGDLYLSVKIVNTSSFERKGNDLFQSVDVDYLTAILGGEIKIKTIAGKNLTMKIPKGTKTGNKMRISGKGMPILNETNYGDLYITLNIQVSDNISEEELKLLEEIKKIRVS